VAGEAFVDRDQQLFGVAVDPLQVLDDEEERAARRAREHERLHGFHHAAPALRLVEAVGFEASAREAASRCPRYGIAHSIEAPSSRTPASTLRSCSDSGSPSSMPKFARRSWLITRERHCIGVRGAMPFEDRGGASRDRAAQLVREARLADTGVADERDQLRSSARARSTLSFRNVSSCSASRERRQAALKRKLEARAPASAAAHRERLDRHRDSLECQRANLVGDEIARDERMHRFADQHAARLGRACSRAARFTVSPCAV
jgi:hypothetical protein